MRASKRLKTKSSGFPLEPQPKPETVPLFKLVSGRQNLQDSITIIYPVLPDIGWSLEKEAFKIDSSKEVCHHFALFKEEVSINSTAQVGAQLAIGNSLYVFAPGTNTRAECLRFAFSLSKGNNEALLLPPVVSLMLELVTGSGYKCEVEFNFSPGVGVSSSSQPAEMMSHTAKHFVYHGVVDKTNPKWAEELSEFLWSGREGELPTVQIKGVKTISVVRKGFELDPKTVLTPFTLIDKDSNRHPCHKEVLTDQCAYLRERLGDLTEIKVVAGSAAVKLILHHFYHPRKPLLYIANFEVSIQLARLALRLGDNKLLGIGVDNLIKKLDQATSTQLKEVYDFIHGRQLKFKTQLFFKLWRVLLFKIRDRILAEDDGKTECFDQVGSFLNLSAFTKDGKFCYELLEELCRDLNRIGGESQTRTTQQFMVQSVLNRFKGDVIKRMGSKLVANKIKL